VELKITVATSGDYFFFATSPDMVREALAVRAGKQPGLRQNAEFAALLKHLPTEGNQFMYADKRFSGTILDLQKQAFSDRKKTSSPHCWNHTKIISEPGPNLRSLGWLPHCDGLAKCFGGQSRFVRGTWWRRSG
jgi:hypothetical protein